MSDTLYRFTFDHANVRGTIVQMDASYAEARKRLRGDMLSSELLGQALCASLLMSAHIKTPGTLAIQAVGSGPVSLLLAEATHQRNVRGIVRLNSPPESSDLRALLGDDGRMAVTITPQEGNRYQGVVPLEHASLSACLEGYFLQSEQLPTRLWLVADAHRAAGLMLQVLPAEQRADDADWVHLTTLADTVTEDELLHLPPTDLLYRLFHEEDARVYDPENVRYACTCSEQRTLEAICQLGREEAFSILDEQGAIEVQCQFCNQPYRFDRARIEKLFADPTLH
ncbi:MAG: Hsp33 family molecular chaperone HslO [Gammaproteobacteria bacterium]|nr:MAG: Hsp33 family molecular chaperone HslO [Gammaproteobacteria bacterium]